MAGAPIGNQNAKKGAEWRSAIKRALARYSNDSWRKGLDEVADQYVKAAASGDLSAIRDMADRLDGKPTQSVELDAKVEDVRNVTKEYVSGKE